MPVIRTAEAVVHDMHGVRFVSYASRTSGAQELRAWRGEVPPRTPGVAHVVSHEEVVNLLSGKLRLSIDDAEADLLPGDVAVVPAGAEFRVDNLGDVTATMWVTTTAGLRATLPDGTVLSPPWAD